MMTKTGTHSLCSCAGQINNNLGGPSAQYRHCDLRLGVIRSRLWPFAREDVVVSSPQATCQSVLEWLWKPVTVLDNNCSGKFFTL